MVIDTILGIIKAWRISKEDTSWFSSRRLKVGIVSKISILMMIM